MGRTGSSKASQRLHYFCLILALGSFVWGYVLFKQHPEKGPIRFHQPLFSESFVRKPSHVSPVTDITISQIQRRRARISLGAPGLQGGAQQTRCVPKRPNHSNLLPRLLAELHLLRAPRCGQTRSSLCRLDGDVGDVRWPGNAGRRRRTACVRHGRCRPHCRWHGDGDHLDERATVSEVSRLMAVDLIRRPHLLTLEMTARWLRRDTAVDTSF